MGKVCCEILGFRAKGNRLLRSLEVGVAFGLRVCGFTFYTHTHTRSYLAFMSESCGIREGPKPPNPYLNPQTLNPKERWFEMFIVKLQNNEEQTSWENGYESFLANL